MKRLCASLLALLFSVAIPAAIAEVLPATMGVDDDAWQKVGESQYRLLWRRITVAGLYIDPEQGRPESGEILDHEYAKALMIEYGVGVSAARFARMAREALEDAWPQATLEELQTEIDRFYDWFESVSSGDRYAISWRPDEGLILALNGRELGRLRDPKAAEVILSIWLGRAAISEDQRDEILDAWRGSTWLAGTGRQ